MTVLATFLVLGPAVLGGLLAVRGDRAEARRLGVQAARRSR